MPRLKDHDVKISDEEEAAINAGIALDPDNPELDDDFFKNAKSIWEVHPPEICEMLLAMGKQKDGRTTRMRELAHV